MMPKQIRQTKLVRDRMDDIPWRNEEDKRFLFYVDTRLPVYRNLLHQKVREESAEVAEAATVKDAVAELVDLYEAMLAMMVEHGTAGNRDDAMRIFALLVDAKYDERGGFLAGLVYSGPVRADHPYVVATT